MTSDVDQRAAKLVEVEKEREAEKDSRRREQAEAMQHGAGVTDKTTATFAVLRPVTRETQFYTYSLDGYCEVTVSGPCDTCGRTVTVVEGEGQYYRRRHLFCSRRCRGLHYNHVRSERGARAREKVCGVCGEEFTAKRVDAKTCSPACKQKAYRRRSATSA